MLLQPLLPVFSILPQAVYAQEAPTPTEEVTPSPTAETTPEPTVAPTPTEEVTPSPTAETTPEVTPTPEVSLTPTEEVTPIPTTTQTQPSPSESNTSQQTNGPPKEDGDILDGVSTEAPSPTATPTVTENGTLAATILEHAKAESLDLDNTDYSSATLTTDKADYAPTDTALISGTGFVPEQTYLLTISSNDPPATSTSVQVTTNENGSFVYAYQLDGIYRPDYSVVAAKNGGIVAQTTFTDSNTTANNGSTFTTTGAGGTIAWSNSSNAQTSSGSYATVTLKNKNSENLKATGFGFSIPVGSTIDGIIVNVEKNAAGADIRDLNVQLINSSSTVVGTNKANTTNAWSASPTDATVSYGSASDTWTAGLTYNDVNSANFGVSFSARNAVNTDQTANVDHINIQVFYTEPVVTGTPTPAPTNTLAPTPTGGATPTPTPTPAFECTDDLQGPNDEPGQKDLNEMCVNDSDLPDSIDATWNWDETGWSGDNTGDACALFDTNGNGFADFASCVTVEDDPATQASNSPRIYTCNDTKVDRCAGDALVAGPYASACSTSIVSPQTFPAGDDSPNDTHAACTIEMSEVGGAGTADLIDVCSYPSQQPNSDPSDCIVFEPGTGRLEVVKDLIPEADTGLFNLQINGTTLAANVGDGGTTGEEIYQVSNNGTLFTVGETAGTATDLSDYAAAIVCKDGNGLGTTVASSANSGPLNVTLNEDDDIVCTITNTLQNGTIVVHKDVQGPVGENIVDTSQNFTVQLDGANGQTVTDGGTVTYLDVSSGSHTITESVIPAGYVLYSITPDSNGATTGAQVTVVPGQTTDVYVVNRVEAQPAVGTVKTLTSTQTALVGDTVTFDLVATNSGNVTLYNPVIFDTYDASYLEYVSSDPIDAVSHSAAVPDTSDYDGDGNTTELIRTLSWNLPADLAPGESYTVTVTFTALQITNDDPTTTYTGNEAWTEACTTDTAECDPEDKVISPTAAAVVDIDALGSVSGYKFFDANGDGVWLGEATMSGVTVTLYDTDEEPDLSLGTDVTDTNGLYSFEDLATGNYKVCETVPAGYAQTFPAGDACHVFSVTDNGDVFTDKNFGNRGDLTISGLKLGDEDGDIQTTDGQEVLSGWVIELWKWVNDAFVNTGLTDTTDGSGIFSFVNLIPGVYQLREQLQAGWAQLFPTGGAGIDVTLTDSDDTTGNNFVNTEYGTITVEKQTDPDGSIQSFDFDLSYGDGDADLADGQQDNSGNLLPGTYSVSENTPAGWDLLSATCTDGSNPSSISLQSGEDITCTFTNQKDSSITVFKQTIPDGSTENFAFDADYHADNFLLTDEFADLSGDLAPGTYSVTELPEDGWDLTSATCSDGSDPSSISLQSGEDIICTFTNTQRGHIIVDKVTNPTGSEQSFSFDGTGGAYADFALTDAATPNNQSLVPGTYSVSETVPTGWNLTNTSCISSIRDTESAASLELDAGETITCTFTNTELSNVTVVKYNDKNGNGVKNDNEEVLGDTGVGADVEATRWEMHLVGTDVDAYQWTGAQVQGQVTFGDLLPNTFTLSEQLKSGWVQTNITCGQQSEIYNAGTDNLSFPLAAGEDLTCYVGNQGQGTITVYKNVDANGDGDLSDAEIDVIHAPSWTWDIDGSGNYSASEGDNTVEGIAAGAHTISEDQQTNYHVTNLTCGETNYGAVESQEVTLTPGQDLVCTFTNTRDTGTIIVNKIIDADGNLETTEDQFDGEGWEMGADGFGDASDFFTQFTNVEGATTFAPAKTGNYNVRELQQLGFDLIYGSCGEDIADGSIVFTNVSKDETVNCTFINSPNGSIHGRKWSDADGNGQMGEEDLLGDWTINLYKLVGETYELFQTTTTDANEGAEFGWYWFTKLFPGDYKVCEVLQGGWAQTYPVANEGCHLISLPDENPENLDQLENFTPRAPVYDFGNEELDPILTISKLNNTAGDKVTGDSVLYTLTVTATQSAAHNVTVTDLLPEGFTYRVGSWTASSSNGDDLKALGVTTEPTYASPGTWQLGDMDENEVITLTYLADIGADVKPGLYKDLAWAAGCVYEINCTTGDSNSVISLAVNPGFVTDTFVGTQVNVVKNLQSGGSHNVTVNGEVLGASIELPDTGADSAWLVIAALTILFGLGLITAGKFAGRKYV